MVAIERRQIGNACQIDLAATTTTTTSGFAPLIQFGLPPAPTCLVARLVTVTVTVTTTTTATAFIDSSRSFETNKRLAFG